MMFWKKYLFCVLVLSVTGCNSLVVSIEQIDFRREKDGIEVAFLRDVDQPLTGSIVRYYDGQVKEFDLSYRNGLQHGPAIKWYTNGVMESKEDYIKGKKHGFEYFWHPNGQLARKAHYVEGEPYGKLKEWYENGQQSEIAYIILGCCVGELLQWDENGKKVFSESNRRGTVIREIEYHFNGEKSKEVIYGHKGSVLVGKWDVEGIALGPIMSVEKQNELLKQKTPPFQPVYDGTLTVQGAADSLGLSLPVEARYLGGYFDGGTEEGVLIDCCGRKVKFRRSPWGCDDPVYYYIDFPAPSGKPIKLEYNDKRFEAIKVLCLNWIADNFSKREIKKLAEHMGLEIGLSDKEGNAISIMYLFDSKDLY